MIRFLIVMALLPASLAPCGAAQDPNALRVSNDGLVRLDATLGRATWSGTMSIGHPRFHLEARGTATMFGGPSIRLKSARNVPLKAAKFETETQWISLVVLGSITVTVQDLNGNPMIVKAQRVVYVPAKDQLLIDGKLWRFTAADALPAGKDGP
ncbi:MAG: hypothetical protein K9N23_00815 [Akkermansiaceae bacterium]|nr:hypothetical protein [Akkermansiaceae bacterium]MCF7730191.1 hypothetical protein [Akkermansiaceae bacterium]